MKITLIFPKMLVWGKWPISDPKMAHPLNSRLALRAFKKILQNKCG